MYPRQNIKINYLKALESEEMWGDPRRESKLERQICTKFLVFTSSFSLERRPQWCLKLQWKTHSLSTASLGQSLGQPLQLEIEGRKLSQNGERGVIPGFCV